ncbi:MAG: succinate dehydrogenase assembly factor 2 [Pseudomonadota bacterium]
MQVFELAAKKPRDDRPLFLLHQWIFADPHVKAEILAAMSEALTDDKKQLLYRAMHRGFKEADIVVGRFAQAHLPAMEPADVEDFRRLLDVPDQELYAWIIGRAEAPENYRCSVLEAMQSFDVAATMER